MDIIAFPAFHDLKVKSSKEGGFSDGGVVCGSQYITRNQPVDIAPVKGTALQGVTLPEGVAAPQPGSNASIVIFNFDPAEALLVDTFYVREDGTEIPLAVAVSVAAGTAVGIPMVGTVITHPNKFRVKVANSTDPDWVGPARVKPLLVQFDIPSDLG